MLIKFDTHMDDHCDGRDVQVTKNSKFICLHTVSPTDKKTLELHSTSIMGFYCTERTMQKWDVLLTLVLCLAGEAALSRVVLVLSREEEVEFPAEEAVLSREVESPAPYQEAGEYRGSSVRTFLQYKLQWGYYNRII